MRCLKMKKLSLEKFVGKVATAPASSRRLEVERIFMLENPYLYRESDPYVLQYEREARKGRERAYRKLLESN